MFKDNRTIEEIQKNILLIQEQTEAIKKKGEEELNALKLETEAIRKEGKFIEKDLRKSLKELSRQMYKLGINIGLGVEESVYNVLLMDSCLDGIEYNMVYKNTVYKDPQTKSVKGESDIILVNGEHASIVEIKHRLTVQHVKEFYKNKLPLFIQYESKIKDKKIHIYFAGDSYEKGVIKEAEKKGCGILEPKYNDIVTVVKANLNATIST